MFPEVVPEVVGLNFTVNATLSPGTRSTGAAIPVAENAAELVLICERVTLPVPVFLTVVTADAELPTFTLLKLRAAGETVKVPTASLVPTPVRVTVWFGLSGSSLVTATSPE